MSFLMTIVQDFWNVPVYDPLLQSANKEFGAFIIEGQGTAQEAMDNVAVQHLVSMNVKARRALT